MNFRVTGRLHPLVLPLLRTVEEEVRVTEVDKLVVVEEQVRAVDQGRHLAVKVLEGEVQGREEAPKIKTNADETSDIKVDRGTIIVNGVMIRRWLVVDWGRLSDQSSSGILVPERT